MGLHLQAMIMTINGGVMATPIGIWGRSEEWTLLFIRETGVCEVRFCMVRLAGVFV